MPNFVETYSDQSAPFEKATTPKSGHKGLPGRAYHICHISQAITYRVLSMNHISHIFLDTFSDHNVPFEKFTTPHLGPKDLLVSALHISQAIT